MRTFLVVVIGLASLARDAAAQADLPGLELALSALKMTTADLSFRKDMAESEWIANREFLQEPLRLPRFADEFSNRLRNIQSLSDAAGLPATNLAPLITAPEIALDPEFLRKLPPSVASAIQRFVAALPRADFVTPSLPALAAFATDNFQLSQDPGEIAAWENHGLDVKPIRELIRRSKALELDDDEPARDLLSAGRQLDRARLDTAFQQIAAATDKLISDLQGHRFANEFVHATDTPLGKIIVGGVGDNVYTNDAFLVVDLGGHNRFVNNAGGANGFLGRPIAVCVTLGGDNEYTGDRSFVQGAGLFGVGILVDLGTNATFTAKHMSQGAGFFGCGLLVTGAGRHSFTGNTFCQGAGMFGAGMLWQRGGDTSYRAAERSQAFSSAAGIGVLLDTAGNDTYLAASKSACGWLAGHNFTLAQGMAIGMRPFAGGGLAVLCDLRGHDRYEADVYGQGTGYWYATGLLLDGDGNDTYKAYQYCQGAGIHLAAGLLQDDDGNDTYEAHAICQGGAHDYSVGIHIENAGDDRYTANSTVQGSALNNSFALLFDRAGDDHYTGTDLKQAQAAGHDGGRRENGSIATLLDLAGNDTYSQGWTNGAVWLKPYYGVGMDLDGRKSFATAKPPTVPVAGGSPLLPVVVRGTVDPHHPSERLLRRALRDPETDEERKDTEAAAKELKERATAVLPYLITRLDSPSVMVRAKVEELVDQLGTNAVPLLVTGITTARNDEVARLCCYFLARFESATNAIPAVLPLLERERARTAALYTLGHLRAQAAFGPAVRALRNPQEVVRMRAAQALGRIGHPAAVPHLLPLLEDELWPVRYAAEDALVRIGWHSVEPLRDAFASAKPLARRHLVAALAKLKSPAALPLAKVAWRDADPLVREAVLSSLRAR